MLSPMWLAIIIFAITYIFIASEKVDKTVAALIGASLVIGLHAAHYEELLHKVDLNVLALLVGMMVIVDILATTGIFEWIAIMIARKSKGNAVLIMVEFLLVTAILSALLDNVTTVILVAPITILIAQILELPAVPLLIMEAVFSNIGGTSTLVGDPPNILIGSKANLTFNEFLLNLTPPVIIIAVVILGLIYLVLRKSMVAAPGTVDRIMKARPERAIVEPKRLKRALPVFALVLLGFFVSRLIDVEPGVIALCGAFAMVLVCGINVHHVLEKVEWATILFFVGLFILIGALEANGVFELLGKQIIQITKGNLMMTVMVVLWFSAFFSAVVDNIPLVIAMIPLIKSIIPVFAKNMGIEGSEALIHTQIEYPLYWALALGACLGGNGTLIGASANVVIGQIARRNKYELSFLKFTQYGLPMMIVSLIISTIWLYFRYFFK